MIMPRLGGAIYRSRTASGIELAAETQAQLENHSARDSSCEQQEICYGFEESSGDSE